MDSLLSLTMIVMGVLVSLFAPIQTAVACGVAAVFLPFARLEIGGAGGLGVRPEDIIIVVVCLRSAIATRAPAAVLTERHIPAQLYFVLGAWIPLSWILSLLQDSGDPLGTYLLQKTVGSLILTFLLLSRIKTQRDLAVLSSVIVAAGFILMTVILFAPADPSASSIRRTSTSFSVDMYNAKNRNVAALQSWNPNVIGLVSGSLIVLTVALFAAIQRRAARFLLLIAGALFVITLMQSYTRTAMLAMAAASVYMTIRMFMHARTRGLALAVAVGTLLAGSAVVARQSTAFQFDLEANQNAGNRMVLYKGALEAIAKNPLGYGVGLAEAALGNEIGLSDSAHNDWLDFALNLGVHGCLFAMITYVTMFVFLIKCTKRCTPRLVGVAAEGMWVYLAVCSLGLQVFTFAKQETVIIGLLLAHISICLAKKPVVWSYVKVSAVPVNTLYERTATGI